MSIFNTPAPSKATPTMPAKGPMSVLKNPPPLPPNHSGDPVRNLPNRN
jgi:hypothetical protein